MSVNPPALPPLTVGSPVPTHLPANADFGVAPYRFRIAYGALPPGLSLHDDGYVAGVPTAAGNFSFTISATDSTGHSQMGSGTCTVACPGVYVSPSSLPAGYVGSRYHGHISVTTQNLPATVSISGALPAGLQCDSNGDISGLPTVAGTSYFNAIGYDKFGCTGTQQSSILILPRAGASSGRSEGEQL